MKALTPLHCTSASKYRSRREVVGTHSINSQASSPVFSTTSSVSSSVSVTPSSNIMNKVGSTNVFGTDENLSPNVRQSQSTKSGLKLKSSKSNDFKNHNTSSTKFDVLQALGHFIENMDVESPTRKRGLSNRNEPKSLTPTPSLSNQQQSKIESEVAPICSSALSLSELYTATVDTTIISLPAYRFIRNTTTAPMNDTNESIIGFEDGTYTDERADDENGSGIIDDISQCFCSPTPNTPMRRNVQSTIQNNYRNLRSVGKIFGSSMKQLDTSFASENESRYQYAENEDSFMTSLTHTEGTGLHAAPENTECNYRDIARGDEENVIDDDDNDNDSEGSGMALDCLQPLKVSDRLSFGRMSLSGIRPDSMNSADERGGDDDINENFHLDDYHHADSRRSSSRRSSTGSKSSRRSSGVRKSIYFDDTVKYEFDEFSKQYMPVLGDDDFANENGMKDKLNDDQLSSGIINDTCVDESFHSCKDDGVDSEDTNIASKVNDLLLRNCEENMGLDAVVSAEDTNRIDNTIVSESASYDGDSDIIADLIECPFVYLQGNSAYISPIYNSNSSATNIVVSSELKQLDLQDLFSSPMMYVTTPIENKIDVENINSEIIDSINTDTANYIQSKEGSRLEEDDCEFNPWLVPLPDACDAQVINETTSLMVSSSPMDFDLMIRRKGGIRSMIEENIIISDTVCELDEVKVSGISVDTNNSCTDNCSHESRYDEDDADSMNVMMQVKPETIETYISFKDLEPLIESKSLSEKIMTSGVNDSNLYSAKQNIVCEQEDASIDDDCIYPLYNLMLRSLLSDDCARGSIIGYSVMNDHIEYKLSVQFLSPDDKATAAASIILFKRYSEFEALFISIKAILTRNNFSGNFLNLRDHVVSENIQKSRADFERKLEEMQALFEFPNKKWMDIWNRLTDSDLLFIEGRKVALQDWFFNRLLVQSKSLIEANKEIQKEIISFLEL